MQVPGTLLLFIILSSVDVKHNVHNEELKEMGLHHQSLTTGPHIPPAEWQDVVPPVYGFMTVLANIGFKLTNIC